MRRILIADDFSIVRSGLSELLHMALDPVTIGEARHAEELLAQVLAEPWDIVLLGMSLAGRDAIDLVQRLRQARHRMRILLFSSDYEDARAIMGGLISGATAYLASDCQVNELVAAIVGPAEECADDQVQSRGQHAAETR